MTPDTRLLQPIMSPAPDGARFWEMAARHRLELPYCASCRRAFFYPRILCPTCGSRDITWVRATGRGTLYSFCVHYQSSVPGLAEAVPFATALVELEEGPRMMAFLVGVPADPERIRCGVAGEVEFLDLADGHTALAFRPTVDG